MTLLYLRTIVFEGQGVQKYRHSENLFASMQNVIKQETKMDITEGIFANMHIS